MRVLLRLRMDTEKASKAVADGTVAKLVGELSARTHPEATYFTSDKGKRCAYIVFDMQDSSELPALCEPAFDKLGAEIDISPVMNLEDLQRGLQAMGGA